MRDWFLGSGDPLCLSLAADFRLGNVDFTDDHIWGVEFGSGEPAALSLHTTYGLRARAMRIFPRFSENGKTVTTPAEFAAPPRLRRFYPNYLSFNFSPLAGIETLAEMWIPESHALAGRLTVTNHSNAFHQVRLDLCGLLIPLEGRPLSAMQVQSVHILGGQVGNLMPVLFLTGGPQPGPGPYPCLSVTLELGPGASRRLTWAQAACTDQQESFDLARRISARPWEAERARLENLNGAQTVDVQTGDPDWDAALAFSQKEALRLFMPANEQIPQPSFVLARNPDHGYSNNGAGTDHPPLWTGQPVLESWYLASLLPGAPGLGLGLLMNFLSTQGEDGTVDCRPGLAGQRGRFLAAPLLAALAWRLHQIQDGDALLVSLFPRLLSFWRVWFKAAHDQDQDGFPEWEHPLQTGYEDNPTFSPWHDWSQGASIRTAESPALAALLAGEADSLVKMSAHLQQADVHAELADHLTMLKAAVDSCWYARTAMYRLRDRDSHLCQSGKLIARQRGPGEMRPKLTFETPVRLVVQVQAKSPGVSRPEVAVYEYVTRKGQDEVIPRASFEWHTTGLVATSQHTFTRIGRIDIRGVGAKDRVVIRTVDLTGEDHSLFLPLWARVPDPQRAQVLIGRSLLNAERFDRPFGVPACPFDPDPQAGTTCLGVHLPWNQFIVEGLLAYGFRNEAARLTAHLMTGIIQNLKQNRSFFQTYHAETGAGMGERNALVGLAPLGLFLKVLGVEFLAGGRVRLEGKNPFPWPVTVRYRGLTVIREAEQTRVVFADGQMVTVQETEACVVFP